MKANTAKKRMLEGKAAIGVEVGLGSPLGAEILSHLGFDFVVVDNQHGSWRDESTMHAFRSIGLGPAVPMARVRRNDFGLIGRMLDMGAMGVVVPMVSSVEEAEAAAFAARFPPRGGRSGGPFATGFLGADYMDRINDELFLAIQIETAQGAAEAERIMAVDGIDGSWIGKNDLRLSMGLDISSRSGREAHQAAIMGVVDACLKTGKIPGIPAHGPEETQHWIDRGCLFVTANADAGFMLAAAGDALKKLGRSD